MNAPSTKILASKAKTELELELAARAMALEEALRAQAAELTALRKEIAIARLGAMGLRPRKASTTIDKITKGGAL